MDLKLITETARPNTRVSSLLYRSRQHAYNHKQESVDFFGKGMTVNCLKQYVCEDTVELAVTLFRQMLR